MRIALDPWGSDHASQLAVLYEVDTEDTSVQALDEEIEERPWAPVTPLPATVPAVTAVVDGVMRSDASAMVIEGERRALALFGSYATGAVIINSQVQITHAQGVRLFISGSNWPEPGNFKVPLCSDLSLWYQRLSSNSVSYD